MKLTRMAQSNPTGVLTRKGHLDTLKDTKNAYIQRKDHTKIQKEVAIGNPRREASGETKLDDDLILDI